MHMDETDLLQLPEAMENDGGVSGQTTQSLRRCESMLRRLEEQRAQVQRILRESLEQMEQAQKEQLHLHRQLLSQQMQQHKAGAVLTPEDPISSDIMTIEENILSANHGLATTNDSKADQCRQDEGFSPTGVLPQQANTAWASPKADHAASREEPLSVPGCVTQREASLEGFPQELPRAATTVEEKVSQAKASSSRTFTATDGRLNEKTEAEDGLSWKAVVGGDTDMSVADVFRWLGAKLRLDGIFKRTIGGLESRGLVFYRDPLRVAMRRPLWKFVHGVPFQIFTSAVILANAIWIGIAADWDIKMVITCSQGQDTCTSDTTVRSVELVFCIWFLAELLLRCVAERLLFVWGPEWKWNLLDLTLVFVSVLDLSLNGITTTDASMPNVSIGRVFRLVKFVRILRLARAIRSFQSFRLLVFSIVESMGSLFWCFLVLALIIYLFAIFFIQGAAEEIRNRTNTTNIHKFPQQPDLEKKYGGLEETMITLFMTISGGMDWADALEPLENLHFVYGYILIFYVFFMFFGVLNVVIGFFVTTTAEVSSKDRSTFVRHEMARLTDYARRIRTFFMEADSDKSGMLSWDEFKTHLQDHQVKAYFQALELDVTQARVLFKLLDTDDSNQVGLDEFLEGCLRLKGQARSMDVNMLLYQNDKVFVKLMEFMEYTVEGFAQIETNLGIERKSIWKKQEWRPAASKTLLKDAEPPPDAFVHFQ
mmetsp:Transcript_49605/g.106204  ORF Transcript_49605/g.106204 Transcript_49605/m.106204 type:complete len:711 (+) Transcript_49605:57-2189(+)